MSSDNQDIVDQIAELLKEYRLAETHSNRERRVLREIPDMLIRATEMIFYLRGELLDLLMRTNQVTEQDYNNAKEKLFSDVRRVKAVISGAN